MSVGSLRLLGPVALLDDAGLPVTGRAAQRHRLALLALLSTTAGHSLSRDKCMAFLWPEADARRARHLLNVAAYVLRKSLPEDALLSEGDDLRLDTERLAVDVVRFAAAIERGDPEAAAALYAGRFLDGFHLSGTPQFEKWVDAERARLSVMAQQALEELAQEAEQGGDWVTAVEWRRRLSAEDPYNTRHVLRFMEALEAAGDRGNALQIAAAHETLLREELGAAPDPELTELARRLREAPNGLRVARRPEPAGEDAPAGVVAGDEGPTDGPTEQPLPVRERAGARPIDSVDAVGAEARPERRRRSLFAYFGATAAGIVALTALVSFVLNGEAAPVADRVVVAPFENRTGDASLGSLERVAADWVANGMARSDLVEVTDPASAYRSFPREAPRRSALRTLTDATGAGTLVTGSYHRSGDSLYFVGHITDARNGSMLAATEPIAAPIERPSEGLEPLQSRLLGGLALIFDDRLASLAYPAGQPPTFEAYREFLVGLDLFVRGDYVPAAEAFLGASRRDSTFTLSLVWAGFVLEHGAEFSRADSVADALEAFGDRLTPLDRRGLDWLRALRKGDRLAVYRAAREAMKLAPRSNWSFAFAEAALWRNRPREALEALQRLDPDPGWVQGWSKRRDRLAWAYHLLGDHDRELEVGKEGVGEAADMIIQLRPRALALAALGREDELNRLFDRLLGLPEQASFTPGSLMHQAAEELRAHGHEEAAARLLDRAIAWWEPRARRIPDPTVYRWVTVRLLYRANRVEESRALIEEWWGETAERDPIGNLPWILGLIAARAGDRAEAERYMSLLERPVRLNAYDASRRLRRRAEIAARLGDRAAAVALLQEALATGLPFGIDSIHVGADLEPLRGYPPFDELVRLKG